MAPLPGTTGGDGGGALSKAKVLNETKWLLYCCCEGFGLGPVSDPLVAAEAKELCIRSAVTTTDIMAEDGLCNQTTVFFCLTQHMNIPPQEGAPTCACFNKRCGPHIGSAQWKSGGLFDEFKILGDTFWIYFCICGGVGVNKMDQGLYAAQFKELCCRGYTNIEPPVVDGVLCGSVAKELCIYSECQMPPSKPNPTIALCTWRLNKETASGPAQVEMK